MKKIIISIFCLIIIISIALCQKTNTQKESNLTTVKVADTHHTT